MDAIRKRVERKAENAQTVLDEMDDHSKEVMDSMADLMTMSTEKTDLEQLQQTTDPAASADQKEEHMDAANGDNAVISGPNGVIEETSLSTDDAKGIMNAEEDAD